MFVIIMFGARISGSHYNPLITFSYVIGNVKQGKFDRILGLFYILAQFAGACAAGFMNWFINGINDYNVILTTDKFWRSTLAEITGSFILVFMYLLSTEPKTKFTKDHLLQTIVLAGSYLAAMNFAGSYVELIFISPVNPAIAITLILFNSSTLGWKSFWIFTMLGFIGSLLAYLFFRFIYVKTIEISDEIERDEAEMEENNKDALLAE